MFKNCDKVVFVVRDEKDIWNVYDCGKKAYDTAKYLNKDIDDIRYYVDKVIFIQTPRLVIKTKDYSQACPECLKPVNWIYCKNCGIKLKYD